MAMESVAEVVCALRNAAQRKEDWFRSLEVRERFDICVFFLLSLSAFSFPPPAVD